MILYYLLFGLIIVGILAIALGVTLSFIISIVIALFYFGSFIFLIIAVKRKNATLLKRTHFNLSLVLRNENDRLYSKH